MHQPFISYAREDIDFVRRLHDALAERGRSAWVDWKEIPPVDKWLAKIRAAIDAADAFVFVISPDSVVSTVCGQELDHAIAGHKRLIPIVCREANASAIRPELSELNYIFARDFDSFASACEQLIGGLDTDLEWVRSHTRLLVRAAEWDREGRDTSFTLRGRDLTFFEGWLARSPEKKPEPTTLQTEYLLASRQAVTRRQRIVAAAVAVGLSVAFGLATVAYFQNRERVRQETIASARQLVNRADALRDGPVDEPGAMERLGESTRAAALALRTLHGLGVPSLDADQALRKSYSALPKWHDIDLGPNRIDAAAFDATGTYLGVFLGRERLDVWDMARRQAIASCELPLQAMQSALALALSTDGRVAAVAIYDATAGRGDTEVSVLSLSDCSVRLGIRVDSRSERIALVGHGEYLAVHSDGRLRVWDVAAHSEPNVQFGDVVSAFAPGPSERQLAVIERTRGDRTYWIRIRDLDSGIVMREWQHPQRADWMQWQPRALTAGDAASAWIYDAWSGELTSRESIESGRFALSSDGRLVAVAPGKAIIQIRAAGNGAEVARTSHDAEVSGFAFGPDNTSLTTVDRVARRIRVWQFDTDASYAVLDEESAISRVEFAPDGSQLIMSSAQGSRAWRLPRTGEDPTLRRQEAAYVGAVQRQRVEFTPGSCGDKGGTVTVSAGDAESEPRPVSVDAGIFNAVVSRDGNRLAVLAATESTRGGCRRRLEMWNPQTSTLLATHAFDPVLNSQSATYLQFAGDDRFLVIGIGSGVEIIDAERLTAVTTIYHRGVTATAMLADGTLAATLGSDRVARIWRTGGPNEIARIETVRATEALALSLDHRWLAALEEPGTVRLWALAPEDLIQQACRWLEAPCP